MKCTWLPHKKKTMKSTEEVLYFLIEIIIQKGL